MISLDVADLMVIAGRALDLDDAAVLERFDVGAAQAALTQAALTQQAAAAGSVANDAGNAGEAAAAGVALVRALLVHRPVPRDGMRVAAISGLQFLSVNGWRAELEPPQTAAVVIEALASGRLSPRDAAAWLAPRLHPVAGSAGRSVLERRPRPRPGHAPIRSPGSRRAHSAPRPAPRPQRPGDPRAGRLISTLITLALGGLALLAAACAGSGSPAAPGPGPASHGGPGGQISRVVSPR